MILIPLDDNPVAPNWLPRNRLWIGLERWGIESAASVIEARVQEKNGIIKMNTIADKIASIENEIKTKEENDQYLATIEGKQAGFNEYESLLDTF